MGISISELILDERTVAVNLGDDPATGDEINIDVTYRPSGLTPAVEEDAQRLFSRGMQGAGTARLLSGMITFVDITDDDGNPIPATYEGLSNVPVVFLVKIMAALLADVRQSKEDLKNSAGGSRRAAKSARARSFTR
ncbi:MAG: hypothetical protein ACOYYS_10020 [Chloroflexota bacterium]